MLDDLTKEIKAQLYERVKSPLFGAFAFSWVAWNHRPLLAAISGLSFQEKVAYFDTFYPSSLYGVAYGIAGPLVTAVLFLLLYPYPARWMYSYWASQQKRLKVVQQRIEDDTPMTQEEATALRKTFTVQVGEMEAENAELRGRNKDLMQAIREASEDVRRITKERDEFAAAVNRSEEELIQHRSDVLNASILSASHPLVANIEAPKSFADVFGMPNNQPAGHPLPTSAAVMESPTVSRGNGLGGEQGRTKDELLGKLPEDLRKDLDDFFGSNGQTVPVFLSLVSLGGVGTVAEIASMLAANPIDVEHGLDVIRGKGFADYRTNGNWALSKDGKAAAVELQLTSYIPLKPRESK